MQGLTKKQCAHFNALYFRNERAEQSCSLAFKFSQNKASTYKVSQATGSVETLFR